MSFISFQPSKEIWFESMLLRSLIEGAFGAAAWAAAGGGCCLYVFYFDFLRLKKRFVTLSISVAGPGSVSYSRVSLPLVLEVLYLNG
jgi:hypothetical protein